MTSDWPLILAYHHIVIRDASRYALGARAFERDLSRMLEWGYLPLSLEEALASGQFGRRDAAPKSFTITFDDALQSFAEYARPALERLGLLHQTSVFVPTAFVGGENSWGRTPVHAGRTGIAADPVERLMTWEELAEIAAAGVSVQSHGHRHLPMDATPFDEALADSTASAAALREHGFEPRYLALPFGWHSPDSKRAIAEAGFDAALSMTWGGRDRYEVRRIPVYGTDAALTSWLKRSGRYYAAFDAAAALLGRRRP